MPCFQPLTAYKSAAGAVVFAELQRHGETHLLLLPCGQCVGCRLERSRVWAARCCHEAQMHRRNAFLTLTYAPEKLQNPSLVHRDWQLFMKRLRRQIDRTHARHGPAGHLLSKKGNVRYYMAGEYGANHMRPHFHACLFGHDFDDKKHWKTTKSGSPLYTSETLDKLWGKGFASIGAVTFESAAYIARYILDKITGPQAHQAYERTYEETGEITDLKPEYNRMSLNPAIGKEWYKKYTADVYPEGQILIRGHKSKSPKYYDKQYKKENEKEYNEMKEQRTEQAYEYRNDNTEQRLKAKERVTLAKINQLIRHI